MPKYQLLTGSLKSGKKTVFADKHDRITERPVVEMDAKEAQSLIATGVLMPVAEAKAEARAEAKAEKLLTEADKAAAEAERLRAEAAAKKGGK